MDNYNYLPDDEISSSRLERGVTARSIDGERFELIYASGRREEIAVRNYRASQCDDAIYAYELTLGTGKTFVYEAHLERQRK